MENLSIRAPEKNNVLEKKPLVEKDEQSKESARSNDFDKKHAGQKSNNLYSDQHNAVEYQNLNNWEQCRSYTLP